MVANTATTRDRFTRAVALLLMAAAAVGAACSTSGASSPTSPQDSATPAETGPPPPPPPRDSGPADIEADSPPAAADVVVLVPMTQDGRFTLASVTLGTDGRLRDSDVRLELPGNAAAIAIRADGQEALVMYGRAASAKRGGVAINLTPDGAQASLGAEFAVTTKHGVTDVIYTGTDEAVASMRGPTDDHLLTLKRQGGGWIVGPASPTSSWPQRIYDINQPGRLLFLRSDWDSGQSEVLPMSRGSDGRWHSDGGGVMFSSENLVGLAVSPDGSRAYAATEGAAGDPVNPSGQILSIGKDGDKDWRALPPLATSNRDERLVMSCDGRVMVAVDAVMKLDPTATVPITQEHALDAFAVAPDGQVTEIQGPRTVLPETAVAGLAFGPNETLLVAQEVADEPFVRSFRRSSPSSSEWHEISSVQLEDTLSSTRGIVVGPSID